MTLAWLPGEREAAAEGALPHLRPIDPDTALSLAERRFGVTRADLLSERRQDRLVRARAFAVWALRNLGKPLSYPKIGRLLGSRDHSTAVNLYRKTIALRRGDETFAAACNHLTQRFRESRELPHAN